MFTTTRLKNDVSLDINSAGPWLVNWPVVSSGRAGQVRRMFRSCCHLAVKRSMEWPPQLWKLLTQLRRP